MPETESGQTPERVLINAGVFIGALLKGDLRYAEARPLVEQARRGELAACTTAAILSEIYGALTWEKAEPRHDSAEAARAVRLLVEPPSAIVVLSENLDVALKALELAAKYKLTARRVHDARHAAAALSAGVGSVYTYDVNDWRVFETEAVHILYLTPAFSGSIIRNPDIGFKIFESLVNRLTQHLGYFYEVFIQFLAYTIK
jgi:predicted nucleic acid-binding protein